MYQFNENFNHKAMFWFKKSLIKDMNWALLPKASQAIFPVIACHADKTGKSWPGEFRIAILSGLSKNRVRSGIRGLEPFPGITINADKRPKEFNIKLPQESIKGETFPFYQVVLEYGLWCELKPASKAVYMVMRCFSKFNIDTYLDVEGYDDKCSAEFDEIYQNRKYEFCNEQKIMLGKYAGVTRASIYSALDDLKKNHLIEWDKKGKFWKVYLRGNGTYWKRSYLNQKTVERFGHLLS